MMTENSFKESKVHSHKYDNHRFAANYLKSYALHFQISLFPFQHDGRFDGRFVDNAAPNRSNF